MADDRTQVPYAADEATTLYAYLDRHRETLLMKAAGLDAEQLATPHPPSDLTLGGLLKHMAYVEDWWFGVTFAGRPAMPPFDTVDWKSDPDWELHSAKDDPPEALRALFDRAVAASRRAADGASLDDIAQRRHRKTGEVISLRWIVVHMVEEYARHNGHADLIREAIDGSTGA